MEQQVPCTPVVYKLQQLLGYRALVAHAEISEITPAGCYVVPITVWCVSLIELLANQTRILTVTRLSCHSLPRLGPVL